MDRRRKAATDHLPWHSRRQGRGTSETGKTKRAEKRNTEKGSRREELLRVTGASPGSCRAEIRCESEHATHERARSHRWRSGRNRARKRFRLSRDRERKKAQRHESH